MSGQLIAFDGGRPSITGPVLEPQVPVKLEHLDPRALRKGPWARLLRRCAWVFGLLAPAAFAEVPPTWSVALESSVLAPGNLTVRALGLIGPDTGMYLAPAGDGQLVATLALGTSASARDQFAVPRTVQLTGDAQWLDGNETGALVRHYLDASHSSLHRIDAAGRQRWSLDRRANAARLLDNGDAVVLDGHLLIRLSAQDGRVLWARNLLDVQERASLGGFLLGEIVDGQIDVTARYFHEPNTDATRLSSAWVLAVDAADGELRWAVRTAEGLAHGWRPRCAPQVLGAARIDVRFEGYPAVDSAVVERRDRSSGELQWQRRIPMASDGGGACAVLANGGSFYLSVDEGFSPGRLHALDADDGEVLWERPLQARRPHQMQAAPGEDVILAEVKDDSTGYALARWRASDGTQSWSVEIPAVLLSLGGSSAALSVAWASANAPQARFQQYNPDTGALLATSQEDVRAFQPQAVVAAAIQGQACAAVAVDAPLAYVDVHCRHAASGAVAWTRSLPPLEAGERITLLQLQALGTSRMLVRVSTRLPVTGGELPQDHLHVLALSDGAPLWQNRRIGLTSLVAGADATVYLRDLDCTDPPVCTGATYGVRALDGTTGDERWSSPADMVPLAAGAGVLVGWRQANPSRGFHALDTVSGADAWLHPTGSTSLAPSALATSSGAIVVKYELSGASVRQLQVLRLDPLLGTPLFSFQPSVPAPITMSGVIHESAAGDLLVSAVRSDGGWLARVQLADGQALWEVYPAATPPGGISARFAGPRPDAEWVRVTRTRGQLLERQALARLQPLGNEFAEHLHVSEPARPGEQPGAIQLLDIAPGGEALAFDRRTGRHGLRRALLQGWPVPGTESGDVRIEIPADQSATGMSPSLTLDLQVINPSPHTLEGVVVHADSEQSTLWFRLLGCVPSSACMTPAGDELRLALPAHGTVQVRVEVIDPGYRPGTSWSEDTAVFRADPPFHFGDVDLGNNVVSTTVRLGGMSDGFEGWSR